MSTTLDSIAADVLIAWFGTTAVDGPISPERYALWFSTNPDFDEKLRERFEPLIARGVSGELSAWEDTAQGALALVIVLDQFSRNLYRNSPRAFDADPAARAIADRAIAKGFDQAVSVQPRGFFYLPFEHAEDRDVQAHSVALFQAMLDGASPEDRPSAESLLSYAVRHKVVIDRFGRFPHRNDVLGRVSTVEEREHLAKGKPF